MEISTELERAIDDEYDEAAHCASRACSPAPAHALDDWHAQQTHAGEGEDYDGIPECAFVDM